MCASVRRAARVITQMYDTALAPTGISAPQFGLLAAIQASDGLSQTDLAASMAIDRTTLVRNLKLMERDRLIQVVPGKDGRTRGVSLTGQGREALRRALPFWREVQTRVMAALGESRWHETKARLSDIEALQRL
jgi:DNA-binding MarR family transcriptional regulator